MSAIWKEAVGYLLHDACPSIQYRVRSELLSEPETNREMKDLQQRILKDEAVRRISRVRHPDGWLGTRFHTAEVGSDHVATEVAVRLLCEKGVSRRHPLLGRVFKALRGTDEAFAREFFRVGRILDLKGFGGSYLIRAALFARAGIEAEPFVQEQIEKALGAFRAVSSVESVSDITERYRRRPVFKSGAIWPCIYHLRLLAFVSSWRTKTNIGMMTRSIRRLLSLSPFLTVYVRSRSQVVAPCGILANELPCRTPVLSRRDCAMWFQEMELLSRLGVVERIPELRAQATWLAEVLRAGEGRFARPVAPDYFTKWSAYTGLALEKDWRSERRRVSDLTFRSLLILHYSGLWSLGKDALPGDSSMKACLMQDKRR
jgi:hypothetical protein